MSYSAGLIIIAAPSGAGKTTLCKKLLKDFPQITLSISSTTRVPRKMEREGVDYFFLNHEQFEKTIQDAGFAEWANVHGNYYGTSKKVLEDAFAKHQSVLLDIDVQGAAKLHSVYPDRCLRIFITPPSLEGLEKRLRDRGTEAEEAIQRRLKNARLEMAESHHFDAVVVNDLLDVAYAQLNKLVASFLNQMSAGLNVRSGNPGSSKPSSGQDL